MGPSVPIQPKQSKIQSYTDETWSHLRLFFQSSCAVLIADQALPYCIFLHSGEQGAGWPIFFLIVLEIVVFESI